MQERSYQAPILTVDGVILQFVQQQLQVLVIQRANEPFKGMEALPGGYIVAGETTQFSLGRILDQKAGIALTDIRLIEQLYTFDTVARDPRGHAVSVTYMGLATALTPRQRDTQAPRFVPVADLPELAFDHGDIIAYACARLRNKLTYTNAVFALLPEQFTLTQLQDAYEAIMGRSLDKRNFRRTFLSLNLIEATPFQHRDGAHRPARLYRFLDQTLVDIARSLD